MPSGAFFLVGISWFSSSALFSTWANTAFLRYFKSPLLHTFIRFAGSAVFGVSSQTLSGEIKIREFGTTLKNVFFPALFLWVANFANSVALQYSGITLTYVVKACIPVFTVLVCVVGGQRFPLLTYLSLLPTVIGVALASASDMDFSAHGLLAALTSALSQTLMNISIKEVRQRTGYGGATMLAAMTTVCTVLTLPVIAFNMMTTDEADRQQTVPVILQDIVHKMRAGDTWPVLLMTAAATAYHIEYVLNTIFVGFVSPVAFSVSDVSRRLAIIIAGAVLFGKFLTPLNCLGIALALGGVFCYSYLESKASEKKNASESGSCPKSSSG